VTEGPTGQSPEPARIDPIRAGLLCRCPNCGQGPLYAGFLKVVDRCEACGFDYSRLNTGDGAAIFIMQIAGGIVVFGALYAMIAWNPPIWLLLLITLPLVAGLSIGLMRPGKGVMIALQMRSSLPGGGAPRSGGGVAGGTLGQTPLHHASHGPPPPMGEE
jgi:uncharacterized protein (DUF983 family)